MKMKGKIMRKLVTVGVLIFAFFSISFAKQGTGDNEYIFAKIVDKVSCAEPLVIRAKVVAVNVGKKECLIRVVSEILRDRYIVLEGCAITGEGNYIRGVYCSNQFTFLSGRLEKR